MGNICPICEGEVKETTSKELTRLGVKYIIVCETNYMLHLITENGYNLIVRKRAAHVPLRIITESSLVV